MSGVLLFGALFVVLYGGLAVLAWRRRLLRTLAVREAVRRRGQSLLVVGGLMIGSTAITASLVGADSTVDSSVLNAYRQWGTIDVVVAASNQFFSRDVAARLAADPLLDGVVDGVSGGVDLVGSVADLTRRQGESGVTISGFDPAAQRPFGAFVLTDGRRTFGDDLAPGDVIVNRLLAESLDARVGDTVRVSVDTGTPPRKAVSLRIAGIARVEAAGGYTLRQALFAPLDTAATFIGGPAINVVRISAPGGLLGGYRSGRRAASGVRRAIEELGSPVPLAVREAKAAEVKAARDGTEFIRSMLVGMSAIIVAAGAALIVNLVSMLAEERRPRLGVLRALGLSRRGLVALSALEGALYSVAAAAAGTALGVIGGRAVAARFADAFSQFTGGELDLKFVFHVRTSTVAAAFAAGAVLTLVVVLLSSWRTARMSITAAIRNLPEPEKERRRAGWRRIAGRIVAGLAGAAGVAGREDMPRLLGGVALILLASSLLRHRLSARWRSTLTGFILAGWSLGIILRQDPNADPDTFFAVFVLTMLTTVFGFSVVAVANLRLVERTIGLLGRAFGALRPVLRPPLAYLARRPVRTGLTTGVFALVLGMLQLFAVFLFIFRPQYARDSAGFEVRVLSTGTASIELPESVRGDVERSVLIPTRGYVGPFSSPNGFSGEHLFVPLFELDGALLERPPVYLAQRAKKYKNDRAVWEALRRDPGIVVTNFGSPGQKVAMIGPDGPLELTIAGSQGFGVLDGLIGSPLTLAPFRQAPLGAAMLVDVRPGVSAGRIARVIESDLFGQGVDAASTRKLLDDGYEASRTFFSIIDVLMRMGLVVGILSLGIVGARAVIERRHIIGVLRAIGFYRRAVLGGLMVEAAAVALIGSLVGLATGTLMGFMFYRQTDSQGPFGIHPPTILSALAVVFVAVLLVTLAPAYRASRLPPAEAVRHSE